MALWQVKTPPSKRKCHAVDIASWCGAGPSSPAAINAQKSQKLKEIEEKVERTTPQKVREKARFGAGILRSRRIVRRRSVPFSLSERDKSRVGRFDVRILASAPDRPASNCPVFSFEWNERKLGLTLWNLACAANRPVSKCPVVANDRHIGLVFWSIRLRFPPIFNFMGDVIMDPAIYEMDTGTACNEFVPPFNEDEELVSNLKELVRCNYTNVQIVTIMSELFPKYAWSLGTLKRRLKTLNIRRVDKSLTPDQLMAALRVELEGPGEGLGYRAMYNTIRQKHNLKVTRNDVYLGMKMLCPSKLEARRIINKKEKFRKRQNVSMKPKPLEPLAERVRPKDLSLYVGQDHILGTESQLRKLITSGEVKSMILWGPPGCGKTSLAKVIARTVKEKEHRFVSLSAATSGLQDVKEIVKQAKTDLLMFRRKTVLFLDEIHRFNKLQQDVFLPHVENGTVTLIGATTENPSFALNSALLSRCRVFVLNKLEAGHVERILRNALKELDVEVVDESGDPEIKEASEVKMEKSALTLLSNMCDGDARSALNCLEYCAQCEGTRERTITEKDVKESLQRSHVLYDKTGEEHYNCISALHKSMRGGDANAGLYWLGRMLVGGEDPLYVARRLIRFSSEDVGLADPNAMVQAVATYQACHSIGMPECEVVLAQCVAYLAEAPKSTRVYSAYERVKSCIENHQGPLPGVPLHLRNAPTKLMKDIGYGKGYKYNPSHKGPVEQTYMPLGLESVKFLD